MDATQSVEARILTTLRLNGDELYHLCHLADCMCNCDDEMRAAVAGWLSPGHSTA